MAAETLLSSLLTEIMSLGPRFYPVLLEENSFPVVNCSFRDTVFQMKYFGKEGYYGRVS